MSDAIIVALIMSVIPALVTVASGIINWRQGRATHVIVNNQRTEMMAEIDNLKGELAILRDTMAQTHALTEACKPSN